MNAITNPANLLNVDRLGELQALIASLQAEADTIKDAIKDVGTAPGAEKVFTGDLFKATVVEANRSTVNYKQLLADLGISAEQVAEYTSTSAVFSVRVTGK